MIWVPARVLYHAGRDADLRQFLAEGMLRSGLFPAKLPIEVTARHWAAIYMSCDAKVGLSPYVPSTCYCPWNRCTVCSCLRWAGRQHCGLQTCF